MPDCIEVSVPHLGSRVRFELPSAEFLEMGKAYQTVSRPYILDACRTSLGHDDWEQACNDGGKLEICWRKNGNLEWIWLDRDIDGNSRDWAVIYPIGFRQVWRSSPRFSLSQ